MSETNAVVAETLGYATVGLQDTSNVVAAVAAGETLVASNTALTDRVGALETLVANALKVLSDMFPNHAIAQVANTAPAPASK